MHLSNRDKQIKYALYGLVLCLCSILQNVDGLLLEIGGARCFLLVPVAILLTIDEDEKIASLMGFFAGLLWDINSAHHMGFNAVYIMLACFICSYLTAHMFRNTFFFNMVCTISASLIYSLSYWLMFIIIPRVEGGVWSLFYFYLPSAIYTCICAPILYAIFNPIKKKLNKTYDIQQ